MAAAHKETAEEAFAGHVSLVVIIVFISLALYNVIELNFKIFSTFKRYRGLYFWSFLIGTWGVAFNATGYLLRTVLPTSTVFVFATILSIGWLTMINCQSLVLYSRLHIILQNRTILRAVLIMIIVNAVWIDIPLTTLAFGSMSSNPTPYAGAYAIYERIQLPVFFIQELIISSLYVYQTFKFRKLNKLNAHDGVRRVMDHLLAVNVVVILLDVTILALQYANLYDVQTAWKPLVYSMKLKLEFTILNRLVKMTQQLKINGFAHTRNHTTTTDANGLALSTLTGKKSGPKDSMDNHNVEAKADSTKDATFFREVSDTDDDLLYDNSGTTEDFVIGNVQDLECSSVKEFASRGN